MPICLLLPLPQPHLHVDLLSVLKLIIPSHACANSPHPSPLHLTSLGACILSSPFPEDRLLHLITPAELGLPPPGCFSTIAFCRLIMQSFLWRPIKTAASLLLWRAWH